MRIILRILSVIALGIAGAWLYFDRSFEPALTTVVSISALISTFFFGNSQGKANQSQHVGDGSTGIQSGGDVNISFGSKQSKD